MTLCIAWKNGGQIRFASDSRISPEEGYYADIAIKIMEIPVRIYEPVVSETGQRPIIYDYKLGMCFCGDVVNAYLIKETIYEILQKLQLLPGYTDFSLRGICRIIKKFVKSTSDQLRNGAGWDDPGIEFLIGGFCPEEEKVIVFKFELVDYSDYYEVICDEVLTEEEEMIMMGSGTDLAAQIIAHDLIPIGNSLLGVLRKVCGDDSEPSVGGHLQYGHFEHNNFKIFGIQEFKIDDNGELEYIYAYRGTMIYQQEFEREETDFHIAAKFITPFQNEIDAYYRSIGVE